MRIPSILLALALVVTLAACRGSGKPPQVTVAEVDSTGQLPVGVDPQLYNAGRSVLVQQKAAADKLKNIAERFSELSDTTEMNNR